MAVITLLIGLKKDPTWIPKNMYIFFSVLPKAMHRKVKKKWKVGETKVVEGTMSS